MGSRKKKFLLGGVAVLLLAAVIISLPPVWYRVSYYSLQAYSDVKYWLFPPEEAVFIPSGSDDESFVATSVAATLSAAYPTPTATQAVTVQSTPYPTFTPTPTPPPLPPSVYLEGVIPEPELWNNCGPATLSMNLSYWDWGQTQVEAAALLKPNPRDKNVMPYEMVNFVNDHTYMRALQRMGGDLQTLKALVNAGFPVIIEKGFEPADLNLGWMGHYNLVIGYDDSKQVLTTQDSYLLINQDDYKSIPGFNVTYDDMIKEWRAFNFIFLVVYPPSRGDEVLSLLGPLADENEAWRIAYRRAMQEVSAFVVARDRFFAWYNAGTSLVNLQDYTGAATTYDNAFKIYPEITSDIRPWRMLWYQTGPYFAYYHSGRYPDVIDLADQTLGAMSEKILEESYYWRGMANLAIGERKSAIADFRESLKYHTGFPPSLQQLNLLGETP